MPPDSPHDIVSALRFHVELEMGGAYAYWWKLQPRPGSTIGSMSPEPRRNFCHSRSRIHFIYVHRTRRRLFSPSYVLGTAHYVTMIDRELQI